MHIPPILHFLFFISNDKKFVNLTVWIMKVVRSLENGY